MRYEVVNADDEVVNVIVWDGVAPYEAGDGLSLRPAPLPDPEPDNDAE